jgi:trehalose-6-phosphate synthase
VKYGSVCREGTPLCCAAVCIPLRAYISFLLGHKFLAVVHLLHRHLHNAKQLLHLLLLLLQVADVAVVTATRDGMNLVPYEYVVCRQGPPGWAEPGHKSQSMLVVSGAAMCIGLG